MKQYVLGCTRISYTLTKLVLCAALLTVNIQQDRSTLRLASTTSKFLSNPIELKVIFLEIVYLDLYSDKVWGFSIFSFCTPPSDIYGRPLLKLYSQIKVRINLPSEMIYHILTPLPLEFLPKTGSRSMIVERFSGDHLAPVKRSKTTCTKTLFTSRALRWLLCVILYYSF